MHGGGLIRGAIQALRKRWDIFGGPTWSHTSAKEKVGYLWWAYTRWGAYRRRNKACVVFNSVIP